MRLLLRKENDMSGRYKYEWRIDYYGSGCFLRTAYFTAKSREDALKQLRDSGATVIEILSARRIDRW